MSCQCTDALSSWDLYKLNSRRKEKLAKMNAPSHIETKMWKTWIEANPELAMASTERFCRNAEELGMKKKIHETDGYVYLVADYTEAGLDQYYA